jgi:ATP-dependent RNA helicase DeaD
MRHRGQVRPQTKGEHLANRMVRLSLERPDTARPDVVSTIAYHADIPGATIGKIHIHDRHTLVDVPEQFLGQVLAKAGSFRIHRQPVVVEVA